MSSDIAIEIKNLSKCYQIYDKPSDRLLQMLARSTKQYFREFWAIKDVSFNIEKGETIGIVGRNGSGKSTLLQLICGTLNPTGGTVSTNGRIAALLELGSGFNPEFSGRENVYLNAAVLGLTRNETESKLSDILAFAEIGDFIDQPIKAYSSGMIVRLAFSVAIHVDPEILIVDEALSVGDERFQRKCFSRIESIRKRGATILFVSHSSETIVELCDRAILFEAGEMLTSGIPKIVVGQYQKLLYASPEKQQSIKEQIKKNWGTYESSEDGTPNGPQETEKQPKNHSATDAFDQNLKPTSTIAYEPHGATIANPCVYTLDGEKANILVKNNIYKYSYKAEFQKDATNVQFGMLIKTLSGIELGGAISSHSRRKRIPFVKAGSTYKVEFQFRCALNPGVYFLNAGILGDISGNESYLHRVIDIAMFKVMPPDENFSTGIIDFDFSPSSELIASSKLSTGNL